MSDPELSPESSQPREFFSISYGTVAYYVATGDRDIVYGGVTYTAQPGSRSSVSVESAAGTSTDDQVTVSLPSTHPLVARYVAMGSPPQLITATIYRQQFSTGAVQQLWSGTVTSVAIENHAAKFLVRALTSRLRERSLPLILVDTQCANVLYDARCRVNPASFQVSTTVSSVDGPIVNVVSLGAFTAGKAQRGTLTHVPSGQTMFITSQPDPLLSGNQLTLQAPIVELKAGDAVIINAGCDQQFDTCKNVFNNVINFGGLPQRPTKDPFTTNGNGSGELNPIIQT